MASINPEKPPMVKRMTKATAQVWDNPPGLEWTVPSPAPYHTFDTAPEVK